MNDITLKDLKFHKDALFCNYLENLYDDTVCLLFNFLLITLILINQ